MNIVEKIDKIRVQKGWSFYKLAQESGLTQQTFTKWISGKAIPTIPALESICKAFDISMANLFAENEMIELTDDTKYVFENWNYLSSNEKASIKLIIENYIKNS